MFVVEVLEAGPGFARRGHIGESEKSPGDDLQDKAQQRATAEEVEPAVCARRDLMAGRGFEPPGDVQTALQPECAGSHDSLVRIRSPFPAARRPVPTPPP